MKEDTFTDNAGVTLDRTEVEERALSNVMASMSKGELANFYVDEMPDTALLQWATDENGEF
jgi:hypothetical protein